MSKNKYCASTNLSNEASVEQFFLNRLLQDLGFKDSEIIPKTQIKSVVVSLGSKKVPYTPDYIIKLKTKPRLVIDAKSPSEPIHKYLSQCAGYCLMLNQTFKNENPVQFFLITNGVFTELYEWDSDKPLVKMNFDDFTDSNPKFKDLQRLMSRENLVAKEPMPATDMHELLKPTALESLNATFAWCHQYIYKKGNISQAAGFEEFVKLVFLKLLSDRFIRAKYPELVNLKQFNVKAEDVHFSSSWIKSRESDAQNPMDTIQFHELLEELEKAIRDGTTKRIFEANDHINLSPEIISGVVGKLEHIYLFGIEADLNGRLFERFLNATMRGKDLGQFFTPRSIVKLGTRLADIQLERNRCDVVLDACCGTGGFLIEALVEIWAKIDANSSLSQKQKAEMKKAIADNQLFGVDAGKEPNMSRLTRMNMHLHGDGASKIFEADVLDKELTILTNDSLEVKVEKKELAKLIGRKGFADVVITNPPFAKTYDRKTPSEAKVLDQYELGFNLENGQKTPREGLKSSIMFLERYYDLLKTGGRMVTVIDDGILSGSDMSWVRDFIRKKFIVKAVISLPGDAFQRSQARVKTSLLYLEKKADEDDAKTEGAMQEQGSVFMYGCIHIGLDDPARQRILPIDAINRQNAISEIKTVVELFHRFLNGDPSVRKFVVPSSRIADRMDVKSCLETPGRQIRNWTNMGLRVASLSELVEPIEPSEEDVIDTSESSESVSFLLVTYDGFARKGDEQLASDCKYPELYRVHTGQIVISHISATYGAAAVVLPEFDGCVVAKEFTILKAKAGFDPYIVWMLLRTPEVRADLLLTATGVNRTRVKWNTISSIKMPLPPADLSRELVNNLMDAQKLEQEAKKKRIDARHKLESTLKLDTAEAQFILRAFKPPK